MVRLCTELVTAWAGAAAEEHPPALSATTAATAADPRAPRYLTLVLPLPNATLRQDTLSSRSPPGALWWPRSPPDALDAPPSLLAPSSLVSPVAAAPFGSRGTLQSGRCRGPLGSRGTLQSGRRRAPLARGCADGSARTP